MSHSLSPNNIWAITCYFNPVGYRRRLDNYCIFRERLRLPLVTVELSHNGHYDLRTADADILVQRTSRDLLWQKERLLNIALQSLPPRCDTVAWLDCDLIFEEEDWAERASNLLEKFKLVFPWSHFYELPKDRLPEDPDAREIPGYSLIYALEHGIARPKILSGNMRVDAKVSSGGAGMSRRELIEKHGFYDECIMGSGNRAFACAALGRFEDAVSYLRMNPSWEEHYLAWARPLFAGVRGSVAYLEGNVFHLWHGDLKNRRYAERHTLLQDLNFTPAKDLEIDKNGCWRWTGSADISPLVLRYLESRREDG